MGRARAKRKKVEIARRQTTKTLHLACDVSIGQRVVGHAVGRGDKGGESPRGQWLRQCCFRCVWKSRIIRQQRSEETCQDQYKAECKDGVDWRQPSSQDACLGCSRKAASVRLSQNPMASIAEDCVELRRGCWERAGRRGSLVAPEGPRRRPRRRWRRRAWLVAVVITQLRLHADTDGSR